MAPVQACPTGLLVDPATLPPIEVLAGGICADGEPEAWYPLSRRPRQQKRLYAAEVCAGCPVRQMCLDYAMEAGEEYGVWGGVCEEDRRDMRAGKTVPPATVLAVHTDPDIDPQELLIEARGRVLSVASGLEQTDQSAADAFLREIAVLFVGAGREAAEHLADRQRSTSETGRAS